MFRWRAPWLLLPLGLLGCGREIVLGDSERRLVPDMPSRGGTEAAGGADAVGGAGGPVSGGTANQPGSAGLGGSGGAASMPSTALPEPGAVLWSTDHGSGNLGDWEDGGGFYGGEYDWGDAYYSVEEGAGRNGSWGLITTIDTNTRGEPSQGVRVYRRIEDAPAYYGIWLKLGERHSVSEWWSIFLFHARDDTQSLDDDVSLWDVRVVEDDDGEMTLQFFDHDTMQGTIHVSAGRIEPGQWFELSAYLDYRPPNDTRLAIFHDQKLLFDMKNLHTTLQDNVFWALGNGSDGLDPAQSTIYFDDAAVRSAGDPP